MDHYNHKCCDKQEVKKGLWSVEEDQKLVQYIKANGVQNWTVIPTLAGLRRCGKSCRLRWLNYLRPDVKRGNFTEDEVHHIIQLHKLLGNKWSRIAKYLPGRTDNEVKNYWNSTIMKNLYTRKKQNSFNNVSLRGSGSFDNDVFSGIPNLVPTSNHQVYPVNFNQVSQGGSGHAPYFFEKLASRSPLTCVRGPLTGSSCSAYPEIQDEEDFSSLMMIEANTATTTNSNNASSIFTTYDDGMDFLETILSSPFPSPSSSLSSPLSSFKEDQPQEMINNQTLLAYQFHENPNDMFSSKYAML